MSYHAVHGTDDLPVFVGKASHRGIFGTDDLPVFVGKASHRGIFGMGAAPTLHSKAQRKALMKALAKKKARGMHGMHGAGIFGDADPTAVDQTVDASAVVDPAALIPQATTATATDVSVPVPVDTGSGMGFLVGGGLILGGIWALTKIFAK